MVRKLAIVMIILLVFVCKALLSQTSVTPSQRFVAHGVKLARGSAVEGRVDFVKLRCDSCHSLYREPRAAIPLRDFSHETPETVASLIIGRTDVGPQAYFDEIAMSGAASQMTLDQLANIVSYLRTPAAAKK
jgi:hypothetical protein